MRTIVEKIKEQHAKGNAVVLATLMATEGSTYRRPGARMMITEDGQFHGLVSGGCLEADLVLHAKKVFFDRRSRTVEYDMRAEEEGAWGLALGCNGMVKIHLQYLEASESQPLLLSACEYADRDHQSVLLVTEFSEKKEGAAPTALFANGHCINEPEGGQIQEDDLAQLFSSIEEAGIGEIGIEGAGIRGKAIERPDIKENVSFSSRLFVNDKGVPYLVEQIKPQFHLLVLGAGPDAGPVCTMARLLGWYTTLVDHRVAYVNKASMLDANQVVKAEPKNLDRAVDLKTVDAALLMSHNLSADTAYFGALMESPIPYIGMLGPKDRSEIIIGRQDQDVQNKMSEQLAQRIYAPVGLDTGGDGPEAIALSIVTEIQTQINNCSGKPLRDKSGGIHD